VTLASDVLAFGKSEEPAPQKSAVPLRAALEAAAQDAGLTPEGVVLAVDFTDDRMVSADPEQLHRILVNLLNNARQAIDHGEAGKGVGKVTATHAQDSGMDAIRLRDTGPGLPERARAHIFQPFAGAARSGGTGLGLAIARELAQGHGGELALLETGPDGTEFELRLPRA
jgi:signal transduction histidine kinase